MCAENVRDLFKEHKNSRRRPDPQSCLGLYIPPDEFQFFWQLAPQQEGFLLRLSAQTQMAASHTVRHVFPLTLLPQQEGHLHSFAASRITYWTTCLPFKSSQTVPIRRNKEHVMKCLPLKHAPYQKRPPSIHSTHTKTARAHTQVCLSLMLAPGRRGLTPYRPKHTHKRLIEASCLCSSRERNTVRHRARAI